MADTANYSAGGAATGPTSGGIDVSSIMQGYQQFQAATAASIGDFVRSMGEAKSAASKEQAATVEEADAAQQVNSIVSAATIQRDADNKAAAAWVGANKDASNFSLQFQMERLAEGENELASRRDMIQQKLDQNFLDNPLQWVTNQFTLPFDIAAASNVKEKVQESKDAITKMSVALTEAGVINNVVDSVDEAQRVAALNRQVAAKAQVAVAKSAEDLAKLGVSAVSVRQALDRNQFDALISVFNAEVNKDKLDFEARTTAVSEKNAALQREHFEEVTKPQLQLSRDIFTHTISQDEFHNRLSTAKFKMEEDVVNMSAEKFLFEQQMQRAHLTLAQQQFDLQKEFRDLQIADRRRDDNAREVLQLKLNAYTDTMGMKRITWDEFKLMAPGKGRAAIEAGMQDPNIEQGRIGPTPVTSVQNAADVGAPMTAGMRVTAGKILTVMQTTAAQSDNQGAKPAELQARQEIAVHAALDREASNIPDEGGIFSAPPLKRVLEIPAVIATPLGKELSTLGNANEQFPTKASLVFSTAAGMVEKGASAAAVADQVAMMYKAINADNYDTRQYKRFNIIPPTSANGSATSFRTTVDLDPAGFGLGTSSLNLDMANPVAVEAALVRSVAMRRIGQTPLK